MMLRCRGREALIAPFFLAAVRAASGDHPDPVCPLKAPPDSPAAFVSLNDIANAQPHRMIAPHSTDRVAPMFMPEVCFSEAWDSKNWRFDGIQGAHWSATLVGIQRVLLLRDGRDCNQTLGNVGVFAHHHSRAATLRLHFTGCDTNPTVVQFHLVNTSDVSEGTGEPPVTGVRLLRWMCDLDPSGCNKLDEKDLDEERELEMVKAVAGPGRCSGPDVEAQKVVPSPKSTAGCEEVCRRSILASLKDEAYRLGPCRGYAWDGSADRCEIYHGAPVTESDGDMHSGFVCTHMKALSNKLPKVLPSSPVTLPSPTSLNLGKVFEDPRAITVRQLKVSAATAGCFDPFDWIIFDRYIYLTPQDYHHLQQMAYVKGTADEYFFHSPSKGGRASRANLVVERVCVRDCIGEMRGECRTLPRTTAPAGPGFVATPDGSTMADAVVHVSSLTRMVGRVIGASPASVLDDPDFQVWAPMCAGVTAFLGAVLSLVLGGCWMRCAGKPAYQSLGELKLIYEGDEEETLALHYQPDGRLARVTPNGASSEDRDCWGTLSGRTREM